MWLGPPSSQTMITDLAPALPARAGLPACAALARRRSRSAIVSPPTERPPSLRKLRREYPSQVLPPHCREWKVNIGVSSVPLRGSILRSDRSRPTHALETEPSH